MAYFSKDFLQYFKDLAAHNNRDWFQANKKRYEDSVKKPFELFVGEAINTLARFDKSVRQTTPHECIFRINRDIRFSKDKTPYKLNASAVVSAGGRKSPGASGIYFELGPEKLGLAGGVYMPEKSSLDRIRENIAANPKTFMSLLNEKQFKTLWGDLQGERNKILPAELKKAAEICPYIYNKQFYFWVELSPKLITSENLMETITTYYQAGRPVEKFLQKAFL